MSYKAFILVPVEVEVSDDDDVAEVVSPSIADVKDAWNLHPESFSSTKEICREYLTEIDGFYQEHWRRLRA